MKDRDGRCYHRAPGCSKNTTYEHEFRVFVGLNYAWRDFVMCFMGWRTRGCALEALSLTPFSVLVLVRR